MGDYIQLTRREMISGMTTAAPFVTTGRTDGESETARGPATRSTASSPSREAVRSAIKAARSYLFDNRRGTGQRGGRTYRHWETHILGLNEHGKYRQTLYYALLLAHVDQRPALKQQCLSFLLDGRTDGGGWGETATNYGALLLLNLLETDKYDGVIADIRAENEREEYELPPAVPAEDGTIDTDITYDMRVMYAALSDEYVYEELFPRNAPLEIGRLMAATEAFDGETISAAGQSFRQSFIGAVCAHYLIGTAATDTRLDDRDETLRRCLRRVLLSRRLSSGVWATSMVSVLSILALLETGFGRAEETVVDHTVDWIARNRVTDSGRVEIWNLPVWDTAKALDALHASGLDPSDSRLREAAQWLYQARVPAQEANPVPVELDRPMATYRHHHGDGWGYRENIYSDWDDTAMAIEALAPFVGPQLAEDAEFLLDVQNSDGSWSTFAKDFDPLDDAAATRIKRNMHDAVYRRFFDRNRSPDVTGGALSALGSLGYTAADTEGIRDAIEWLADARADNGLWVGIWGQAFTYGTARVLRGLRAVGVETSRSMVEQAVQTLAAHQNDDGGWGENSSYAAAQANPLNVLYTSAESTPEQTGWAIQALLAGGMSPQSPAIQRGISYLLDTQQSDGSWPVSLVMYNWGGPHYSTGATTQGAALTALGMYTEALSA